ncbi:MAG: hypothetical protein OXC37_03030 [Bdellovibrionaceae bacterium]|nr:hypothetical protein [Pseudobdellovibrionaceae bacterium]
MSLKNSKTKFKDLIKIAKEQKSLFVFDIDSTLFCMKYRTQALIESCLQESSFCQKFEKYLKKLKDIQVTETDWSIPEIMSRYGFHPEEEVVKTISKTWKKGFFSNDYLHLDRPYNNCVNFVQSISKFQAQIYYLTARNYKTMYEGTIQSLNKWEFPLKKESYLIMKTVTEQDDSEYKTQHLKKLNENFDIILFFENEPVILNRVAKQIPHIQLIWMDSTHSRRESPPEKALRLNMQYSFE